MKCQENNTTTKHLNQNNMKASELRIGNYLQGKRIVKVKDIYSTGDVSIFDNSSRFFVEGNKPCLEPIELTEEWLFKFGFECIFTHDDYHYYLESLDLGLDRSCQPFGIGKYKVEFKHVHQLQNLYFALTGEELTFKSE